jgi:hypothetical protein
MKASAIPVDDHEVAIRSSQEPRAKEGTINCLQRSLEAGDLSTQPPIPFFKRYPIMIIERR